MKHKKLEKHQAKRHARLFDYEGKKLELRAKTLRDMTEAAAKYDK